jgi:hypothetical protein
MTMSHWYLSRKMHEAACSTHVKWHGMSAQQQLGLHVHISADLHTWLDYISGCQASICKFG